MSVILGNGKAVQRKNEQPKEQPKEIKKKGKAE